MFYPNYAIIPKSNRPVNGVQADIGLKGLLERIIYWLTTPIYPRLIHHLSPGVAGSIRR
jgi:hypothetical protein